MEFTSKITSVTLLLVVCLVTVQHVHDCSSGYGCFYVNAAVNRKVVEGANMYLGKGLMGGVDNRERMGDWELRTVPSGPDPLHHNGNTPKKPTTP